MSVLRFNADTIKFDADTVTWDAGLYSGVVEFELDDASKVLLTLGNVRVEAFTYDRSMFRSPYGTVWHQEGDFRRLLESITVQAHILDDANGISEAAIDAQTLMVALPSVVRVESAIGDWIIAGLESYSRQPVESGYRFDIQFITFNGIS